MVSEECSQPSAFCPVGCCVDRHLHRILLKSLIGVVGLPIVIAVTVGASALLASVGDRTAARVGAFVALAAGVAWVIVVVSAIVSAQLELNKLYLY